MTTYKLNEKFDRETEKAVGYKTQNSHGIETNFIVWFPKSQIIDGCVPEWLLAAKRKDLPYGHSLTLATQFLDVFGVAKRHESEMAN